MEDPESPDSHAEEEPSPEEIEREHRQRQEFHEVNRWIHTKGITALDHNAITLLAAIRRALVAHPDRPPAIDEYLQAVGWVEHAERSRSFMRLREELKGQVTGW